MIPGEVSTDGVGKLDLMQQKMAEIILIIKNITYHILYNSNEF